jgi:acyl-CoA synthetase (AMP-forming)/AMP-acid ligase II
VATTSIRLTYRELAERMREMAGDLAGHGIRRGDRVLVALPNSAAMVIASLAVQWLGATAVEADRDLAAGSVERVLERTRVKGAVVAARDARRWDPLLARAAPLGTWVVAPTESAPIPATVGGAPVTRLLEDGRLDAVDGAAQRPFDPPNDLDPDAAALVLLTSGSTGEPHGVIQTFRNIDANTRSIVEYLGLTARDRALLTLPLHYCYGRSVLQTHLFAGGSVVMDHRFAFPVVVMEALISERATGFAGVPLTFEILRRQVDVPSMRFDDLRYVTQAGGAMATATAAWVREAFAPAELYVMYGQTEATARLAYVPPARAHDKPGSIGIPIPGVTLQVVDDGGRPLPVGEVGELVARGENITPGYLDEPTETAAILHDGWLWTGDLAYRDAEGYLFLRGRSKEILKIGGHRLSPVEIEQVVEAHPGVAEAAVIGIPDDLMGEVPLAFVVGDPSGPPLVMEQLRDHCRGRLAAYAVPTRFEQVTSLPRTEAGKLRRADLRASYVARG